MVGVGFGGDKSVLARATIVAGNGDVLLDEFCSASEKVRKYRYRKLGGFTKILRSPIIER